MSDVKPGANADLIAEARRRIAGVTFWTADGRTLPQKESLIARLADALEAADATITRVFTGGKADG